MLMCLCVGSFMESNHGKRSPSQREWVGYSTSLPIVTESNRPTVIPSPHNNTPTMLLWWLARCSRQGFVCNEGYVRGTPRHIPLFYIGLCHLAWSWYGCTRRSPAYSDALRLPIPPLLHGTNHLYLSSGARASTWWCEWTKNTPIKRVVFEYYSGQPKGMCEQSRWLGQPI